MRIPINSYKKQASHSISMPDVRLVEELRHYPIAEEHEEEYEESCSSSFFIAEPDELTLSERSGYLPKCTAAATTFATAASTTTTTFTTSSEPGSLIPGDSMIGKATTAAAGSNIKQQQRQHEQVMNNLSGFFLGFEEEEATTTTTNTAAGTSPTSVACGFVESQQQIEKGAAMLASYFSCENLHLQQQPDERKDNFVKLQSSNRTQSMPLTRKSSMKKLSSLGSCKSSNSLINSSSAFLLKPTVSFASLSVREYNVMMGDNPSCSYGVPISLGWDYQQHEAVPVEPASSTSLPKRRSNMLLSYNTRRQLLKQAGYKATELRSCVREVNRIKNERAVTELFLAAQPLEDAMEAAVHRVQSMIMPWKNKDSNGALLDDGLACVMQQQSADMQQKQQHTD